MPNNAYMDEHGVPRFADGSIDFDEWDRTATQENMERLRRDIDAEREIRRAHDRIWLEEHTRYAALSWWRKLVDGL